MKLDGRTKAGRAEKRELAARIAQEWKTVHERVANCPTCRELPDWIFVDYIRDPDKQAPQVMSTLVLVENLGYYGPFVMRCPVCGTYYRHEHSCGYMEHDDSWERLRDSEAHTLLIRTKNSDQS